MPGVETVFDEVIVALFVIVKPIRVTVAVESAIVTPDESVNAACAAALKSACSRSAPPAVISVPEERVIALSASIVKPEEIVKVVEEMDTLSTAERENVPFTVRAPPVIETS